MFKLVLEKAEEPEIKLPTSAGWSKKQESSRNHLFLLIDYAKAFDCVDHKNLENSESDFQRNLYAGQEATVRMGHGTTDRFQIGKGLHQGCILSPCLFKLYTEYIILNAGLDNSQAGIKITGRNIDNLRYADDTTFMQK